MAVLGCGVQGWALCTCGLICRCEHRARPLTGCAVRPTILFCPRRYQTCVHVDDIQPLYDVSGVQAYCINSRRAVLIHPKVRWEGGRGCRWPRRIVCIGQACQAA